jgi:hypothetical protein
MLHSLHQNEYQFWDYVFTQFGVMTDGRLSEELKKQIRDHKRELRRAIPHGFQNIVFDLLGQNSRQRFYILIDNVVGDEAYLWDRLLPVFQSNVYNNLSILIATRDSSEQLRNIFQVLPMIEPGTARQNTTLLLDFFSEMLTVEDQVMIRDVLKLRHPYLVNKAALAFGASHGKSERLSQRTEAYERLRKELDAYVKIAYPAIDNHSPLRSYGAGLSDEDDHLSPILVDHLHNASSPTNRHLGQVICLQSKPNWMLTHPMLLGDDSPPLGISGQLVNGSDVECTFLLRVQLIDPNDNELLYDHVKLVSEICLPQSAVSFHLRYDDSAFARLKRQQLGSADMHTMKLTLSVYSGEPTESQPLDAWDNHISVFTPDMVRIADNRSYDYARHLILLLAKDEQVREFIAEETLPTGLAPEGKFALLYSRIVKRVQYAPTSGIRTQEKDTLIQRVTFPGATLDKLRRENTSRIEINCVEISLVFASILRVLALRPYIFLTGKHAFVGFHRQDGKDKYPKEISEITLIDVPPLDPELASNYAFALLWALEKTWTSVDQKVKDKLTRSFTGNGSAIVDSDAAIIDVDYEWYRRARIDGS